MTQSTAEFEELSSALRRAGATTTASECHGTLSGMFVATANQSCQTAWMKQVLSETDPNNAAVKECIQMMQQLFAQTVGSLESGDMGFQLLLPDDQQSLNERTTALAEWCQGFLYGLSLQGLEDTKTLPAEVTEIITDFSEITKAAWDENAATEESEQAFSDISEFVRVGVQLAFETLNPKSPPQDQLH